MEAGPSSRRSTSSEVLQIAQAEGITTCDACRARKVSHSIPQRQLTNRSGALLSRAKSSIGQDPKERERAVRHAIEERRIVFLSTGIRSQGGPEGESTQ